MKFCLYEVKLFPAFFYGLVIQKSATKTATSIKAVKEIEVVCLSIIYQLWYIKVIKHLQCLFLVIDENDQHWNWFKSELFYL